MTVICQALARLTILIGCTLVVLGCGLSADVAPATSTPAQSAGQRIQFQSGATSATVTGYLTAKATDKWLVSAQSGQKFSAQLTFTSGKAVLYITDSNGKVILSDSANATTYSSVLASSQDYEINVTSSNQTATDYSLTVTLRIV